MSISNIQIFEAANWWTGFILSGLLPQSISNQMSSRDVWRIRSQNFLYLNELKKLNKTDQNWPDLFNQILTKLLLKNKNDCPILMVDAGLSDILSDAIIELEKKLNQKYKGKVFQINDFNLFAGRKATMMFGEANKIYINGSEYDATNMHRSIKKTADDDRNLNIKKEPIFVGSTAYNNLLFPTQNRKFHHVKPAASLITERAYASDDNFIIVRKR